MRIEQAGQVEGYGKALDLGHGFVTGPIGIGDDQMAGCYIGDPALVDRQPVNRDLAPEGGAGKSLCQRSHLLTGRKVNKSRQPGDNHQYGSRYTGENFQDHMHTDNNAVRCQWLHCSRMLPFKTARSR